MCLILLGWRVHPSYPLVVASNRDEFFARPTAAAAQWTDTAIVAGRDLYAGGTWLGVASGGRFAALTNFRDPSRRKPDAPSRGTLVADYLEGQKTASEFADRCSAGSSQYNGFNLLLADARELIYLSNVSGARRALPPGVYGLSNHLLDTPWPKVVRGKAALATALTELPNTAGLFELLRDDSIAPDRNLPHTGVSLQWERLLSAVFVRTPDYGTRASTVVVRGVDGRTRFKEVGFDACGQPVTTFSLALADESSGDTATD